MDKRIVMTSIEWLANVWAVQGKLYTEDIEQAKEMHEKEIIDAWSSGYDEDDRASSSPLKYYQETFK